MLGVGKRNLFRKLVKLRVPRGLAGKTVFSNRRRWALSHTPAVEKAYPNAWFIGTMNQEILSNAKLPHWFSVRKWVRLT